MTALAGYWSFDGAPSASQVERMLTAQAVYGRRSEQSEAGPIALGRRLFPTLPEDDFDQGPQIGAGGALLMVADLRLDNRAELAADLGLRSETLATLCDAALLMAAWEKWGEAAIERLLGDFAFAVFDARRQRLWLARDHLGQRPLHYHAADRFFAFASMPKGLHALPDIPRQPDEDAAAAFLALLPESGSESFFKGVSKVPSGHCAEVSQSGISLRRWWNPAPGTLRLKSPQAYEERVREELDRAVQAQLRGADGRVATHLSAGLDSAAVTATAARLRPDGQIVAFTAAPRADYGEIAGFRRIADEWPLAAMLAAKYANIEHVRVPASGRSPLDDLDRYFFLYERPILNLCNSVWTTQILQEAQARGVSVLLTGLVGNMSFSYDGLAGLPEMLAEGQILALIRAATGLARGGMTWRAIAGWAVLPLLSPDLQQAIEAWRGRAPPSLAEITALHPDHFARATALATERGRDIRYPRWSNSRDQRLWAYRRVDLGNYRKGALAGWNIDERDPTGDRRFIELCLSLPPEQYLMGGRTRSIARRALADRVPRPILDETRKGYQSADWHEALTAARAQVREEITRASGAPEAAGLVDLASLRALESDWPEGGWHTAKSTTKYRFALLRGVSTAHFLRRATGRNC